MGAWIETLLAIFCIKLDQSHPMWVRGLKLTLRGDADDVRQVAPYVGAWIETRWHSRQNYRQRVAPYVGAWIETSPKRIV